MWVKKRCNYIPVFVSSRRSHLTRIDLKTSNPPPPAIEPLPGRWKHVGSQDTRIGVVAAREAGSQKKLGTMDGEMHLLQDIRLAVSNIGRIGKTALNKLDNVCWNGSGLRRSYSRTMAKMQSYLSLNVWLRILSVATMISRSRSI